MVKLYRRVRKNPNTALWTGVVTFFTSMLSFGAINKYDLHAYEEMIVAFFVSFSAAITVYGRQKIYEAEKAGYHSVLNDEDESEGKK